MLTEIISGVVCSFFASSLFAVALFGIKPKIKISDCICVTNIKNKDGTASNKDIYKVKIVNHSGSQLINVIYSLEYCYRTERENISYQVSLPPRLAPTLKTIAPHTKKDKECNYAVRISFEVDKDKYILDKETYFIFTVQATHPFSNGTKLYRKKFLLSDLRPNCKFQTGDSMETIAI